MNHLVGAFQVQGWRQPGRRRQRRGKTSTRWVGSLPSHRDLQSTAWPLRPEEGGFRSARAEPHHLSSTAHLLLLPRPLGGSPKVTLHLPPHGSSGGAEESTASHHRLPPYPLLLPLRGTEDAAPPLSDLKAANQRAAASRRLNRGGDRKCPPDGAQRSSAW